MFDEAPKTAWSSESGHDTQRPGGQEKSSSQQEAF
jgi:hypothetical protein